MVTDATRAAAAAERSTSAAKRGRVSESTLADVRHAARVAREEGVKLRVHRRGCVDVIGVLKQHTTAPRLVVSKVQKKPVEAAESRSCPRRRPTTRRRRRSANASSAAQSQRGSRTSSIQVKRQGSRV